MLQSNVEMGINAFCISSPSVSLKGVFIASCQWQILKILLRTVLVHYYITVQQNCSCNSVFVVNVIIMLWFSVFFKWMKKASCKKVVGLDEGRVMCRTDMLQTQVWDHSLVWGWVQAFGFGFRVLFKFEGWPLCVEWLIFLQSTVFPWSYPSPVMSERKNVNKVTYLDWN